MVYINTAIAQKLEVLSSGLLKGHYIFNRNLNYDNNFGKPEKINHNINYQLTESKELIEQYLDIRQVIYRQAYNDPNVGEDYTDRLSNVFVATNGSGRVIGGVRLTISGPGKPCMLPMEHCGINLRREFPQIDFDKVIFGEASRLAVLPDFRDGEVSDRLLMNSKEYFVRELGAEIGFGCSTMAHTKKFSKFITRLGYNFVIRQDIKVQVTSSSAELFLWAIDFTPDKRFTAILQDNESTPVAEIPLETA